MSFGFSVGDFVLLTQLAWNIVQNTRQACGAHDDLTTQVTSLHIVLRRLQVEAENPSSIINRMKDNDGHREELQAILNGCEKQLNVLDQVLKKYNRLSEETRRTTRLWQKIRFGNGEIRDIGKIRQELGTHTSAITLFLNLQSMGSQGRVEEHMENHSSELKELRSSLNWITASLQAKSGTEGSILTSYAGDDKRIWKEFRRELIKEGFSSSSLHRNKEVIKEYVLELGERGALDTPVVENITVIRELHHPEETNESPLQASLVINEVMKNSPNTSSSEQNPSSSPAEDSFTNESDQDSSEEPEDNIAPAESIQNNPKMQSPKPPESAPRIIPLRRVDEKIHRRRTVESLDHSDEEYANVALLPKKNRRKQKATARKNGEAGRASNASKKTTSESSPIPNLNRPAQDILIERENEAFNTWYPNPNSAHLPSMEIHSNTHFPALDSTSEALSFCHNGDRAPGSSLNESDVTQFDALKNLKIETTDIGEWSDWCWDKTNQCSYRARLQPDEDNKMRTHWEYEIWPLHAPPQPLASINLTPAPNHLPRSPQPVDNTTTNLFSRFFDSNSPFSSFSGGIPSISAPSVSNNTARFYPSATSPFTNPTVTAPNLFPRSPPPVNNEAVDSWNQPINYNTISSVSNGIPSFPSLFSSNSTNLLPTSEGTRLAKPFRTLEGKTVAQLLEEVKEKDKQRKRAEKASVRAILQNIEAGEEESKAETARLLREIKEKDKQKKRVEKASVQAILEQIQAREEESNARAVQLLREIKEKDKQKKRAERASAQAILEQIQARGGRV